METYVIETLQAVNGAIKWVAVGETRDLGIAYSMFDRYGMNVMITRTTDGIVIACK